MMASGGARAFASVFAAPDEPDRTMLLTRVEELPGEQKEAIYLKIFGGLTFREAASVCGVSANTVASRYRYGIEKLRQAVRGMPGRTTDGRTSSVT